MDLHLRQGKFINGILYNSEAWHCLNQEHIEKFELVDKFFLRSLFNSHAKTSSAYLHLETATIPIRYIKASRRLNYLHNILTRKENEVLSRVYFAQKTKPLQGDFVKLVESDLLLINQKYDESLFKSMSKKKFKKIL